MKSKSQDTQPMSSPLETKDTQPMDPQKVYVPASSALPDRESYHRAEAPNDSASQPAAFNQVQRQPKHPPRI